MSDQFCRFQNGKKFSHRQGASLWPRYLAARHRPQLLGRVEGLPRRLGFSTRLRYFLAGSIERRFLCCRRSSRSTRLLGLLLSAVLVLPLTRIGRRGPSLCPAPTRARTSRRRSLCNCIVAGPRVSGDDADLSGGDAGDEGASSRQDDTPQWQSRPLSARRSITWLSQQPVDRKDYVERCAHCVLAVTLILKLNTRPVRYRST